VPERLFLINRPFHAVCMVYTYVYGSQMLTGDSILHDASSYFVFFVILRTWISRYCNDQHIDIFNTYDCSEPPVVEGASSPSCHAGGRSSNPGQPMYMFFVVDIYTKFAGSCLSVCYVYNVKATGVHNPTGFHSSFQKWVNKLGI
jgi:hypothetical protein